MDPHIERPEIWPDFHDRLTTHIGETLQPLLRPRYLALARDRLYVVEADRPIYPDVSIVGTEPEGGTAKRSSMPEPGGAASADRPVVVDLLREEVREPVIHIIEPAAGNRVVTAIEVLSPDNKAPGAGHRSYVDKRDELWSAGSNLVEIDLLREGQLTVRIPSRRLAGLGDWRYVVAVSRYSPPRCEIYAWRLDQRLPRIAVPLAADDADLVLDLQAPFAQTWDAGPYPELLRYGEPPPGKLSPAEDQWRREVLARA